MGMIDALYSMHVQLYARTHPTEDQTNVRKCHRNSTNVALYFEEQGQMLRQGKGLNKNINAVTETARRFYFCLN